MEGWFLFGGWFPAAFLTDSAIIVSLARLDPETPAC